MLKVGIIVGSTRPGRKAEAVARWVHEIARKRTDADFEVVDIQDFNLPLLDEPVPPSLGQYSKPHTKAWAAKVDSFDAFVFVTPEYNHGTSGALKNAIDFLFAEWNNKAAGFVGYGSAGGVRAVEQLRLVFAELHAVTIRDSVSFAGAWEQFDAAGALINPERAERSMDVMLRRLQWWAVALSHARAREPYSQTA